MNDGDRLLPKPVFNDARFLLRPLSRLIHNPLARITYYLRIALPLKWVREAKCQSASILHPNVVNH